jgi:hypothetical protein
MNRDDVVEVLGGSEAAEIIVAETQNEKDLLCKGTLPFGPLNIVVRKLNNNRFILCKVEGTLFKRVTTYVGEPTSEQVKDYLYCQAGMLYFKNETKHFRNNEYYLCKGGSWVREMSETEAKNYACGRATANEPGNYQAEYKKDAQGRMQYILCDSDTKRYIRDITSARIQ